MLYEDKEGRLLSCEEAESLDIGEIEDRGVHVYLFLNGMG